MRRITIEFGENAYGGRDIVIADEYGRSTGPLSFDEALGQFAGMLLRDGASPPNYQMHTPDEWAERERRAEERRRALFERPAEAMPF